MKARSANFYKMRCFVILVLALLLPASARADVADAAFRNGLAAFNEASYARAQEAWVPLATAGDARAQTALGFMYYSGRGVPRDPQRARKLWRRACENDSRFCGGRAR